MKRRIMAVVLSVCLFASAFSIPVPAEDGTAPAAATEMEDTVGAEDSFAMYRMYNPNSGEHFYTGSVDEVNNLIRAGWTCEGIGWYSPKTSNTPIYRLYNPNAGDHHYTSDPKERDGLVRLGWKYEKIGWYGADTKTSFPVYRAYNKNARAGAHNYTPNAAEQKNLSRIGWRDEGVAWYALAKGVAGIDGDPAPVSIEGNVKLNGAKNGSAAKLLISDSKAELASFDVICNGSPYFYLENIYDPRYAAEPGNRGKEYKIIKGAQLGKTYSIRMSWYPVAHRLVVYLNNSVIVSTGNCNFETKGNFIYSVEAGSRANGVSVDAEFTGVRFKGDAFIEFTTDRQQDFFGIKSSATKTGSGYNLHISGTAAGLPANADWDTSLALAGHPISASRQAGVNIG